MKNETPFIAPLNPPSEQHVREVVRLCQHIIDLAHANDPDQDFGNEVNSMIQLINTISPTHMEKVEVYWRVPGKTVRRKTYRCGDFRVHFDPLDACFEIMPWGEYLEKMVRKRPEMRDQNPAMEVQSTLIEPANSHQHKLWEKWGPYREPILAYLQARELGETTAGAPRGNSPRRM